MAQAGGKGQSDLRIDLDLVDAVNLVFDRIFDRDDFFVRKIDRAAARCRASWFSRCPSARSPGKFRAAGGSAIQIRWSESSGKSQARYVVEIGVALVQNAHDHAFAIQGRQRGYAQVDIFPQHLQFDSSILRQPPFGDIQLGHDLYAADQAAFSFLGRDSTSWRMPSIR